MQHCDKDVFLSKSYVNILSLKDFSFLSLISQDIACIFLSLISQDITCHKVKYDRPGECSPEKDCLR